MRTLFAAAVAVLFALPAVADETEGLVLAYDRKANLLVLTDKTIWQLPTTIDVPADLGAGDRVLLEYQTAGEVGLTAIDSLTRLSIALRNDEDGGS
ncbi:hypothetical protein [Antarctobacter heliothermus]|uniref:DUF1344 domain-containing protein n=1 Tax=Antarctobacter heliothermus TaxID=74033 RepID=A0A239BEF3_9RHOB|nr:hypothetical protein [Antarctobacter heliothermus]SNS06417.1 hypothetical protein SAMN04488078_100373 [Antarctobacter heliothermus]